MVQACTLAFVLKSRIKRYTFFRECSGWLTARFLKIRSNIQTGSVKSIQKGLGLESSLLASAKSALRAMVNYSEKWSSGGWGAKTDFHLVGLDERLLGTDKHA